MTSVIQWQDTPHTWDSEARRRGDGAGYVCGNTSVQTSVLCRHFLDAQGCLSCLTAKTEKTKSKQWNCKLHKVPAALLLYLQVCLLK